jgi:hypothetical protein
MMRLAAYVFCSSLESQLEDKATGIAMTIHSSLSNREQAGNTLLAGIGSSELRLEMENISLVTNDAQMMSELSPTPTTT